MSDTTSRTVGPVETFKDAAPYLRRPFTPEAVRFKVQSVYGQNKDRALIVAYIDARLVVERLNLVCPHLWSDDYDRRDDGTMMCSLTVDGITRRDVGDGYKGKGIYSDALKRAAVKFGIGVSLYATPAIHLQQGDDLKPSSKSLALTENGQRRSRANYDAWLKAIGNKTFGEPLDHGDTAESVGDVEALAPYGDPGPDDADPVAAATVGADVAKTIVDRAWRIGDVREKYGMALAALTGEDPGDVTTTARALAATRSLTAAQAAKLEARIAAKEGDSDE